MITNIPIRLDNISCIGELLKRNDVSEWVFLDSRKIDNKLYPELAPGFLYPVYSKKNKKGGSEVEYEIGTIYNKEKRYYVSTADFVLFRYTKKQVQEYHREEVEKRINNLKDRILIDDFKRKTAAYRSGLVNQTLTEALAKQEILGLLFWEYIEKALKICSSKKIEKYKKQCRQFKEFKAEYLKRRSNSFTREENGSIDDVFRFFKSELDTNLGHLYYSVCNFLNRNNLGLGEAELYTYLVMSRQFLFMIVRQARKLIGAPELKELKLTENGEINKLVRLIDSYLSSGRINITGIEKDLAVTTGLGIIQNTYDEYVVFEG